MKELSLHILDIAQNSIVANATQIGIKVNEDGAKNTLTIVLEDNGVGMSPEVLKKVIDPFTTSRTTRRVGMGLPLLNDACRQTGGALLVESTQGKGTKVTATLGLKHIDRQPMGDIAGVIVLLVSANTQINFTYQHTRNGKFYIFSSEEVKEVLGEIPLNSPDVIRLMRELIQSNLDEL
ncbi:MAG TPA: ATP-binding protein [Tenuifilaceae bacterium]|nr:ATP-binding protein [Tenuifilaceae bacterium]